MSDFARRVGEFVTGPMTVRSIATALDMPYRPAVRGLTQLYIERKVLRTFAPVKRSVVYFIREEDRLAAEDLAIKTAAELKLSEAAELERRAARMREAATTLTNIVAAPADERRALITAQKWSWENEFD